MQEQQVELVDAELANALLEPVQRGAVAVVADPAPRLYEPLTARDAGATNAFADLALVRVRGRGVDEPVAGRDGRLDGGGRLFRRTLEDAEAEGRQFDAVVQLNGRDGRRHGHRLLLWVTPFAGHVRSRCRAIFAIHPH